MNRQERAVLRKFDQILVLASGTFLRRLRHRLLIIILLAVVPILGLILYQSKIARDVQIAEAQENAWEILESVAIREARFIDAAQQLLSLLAETPEVAGGDHRVCSEFLKRFGEHNRLYVDIGVADPQGAVLCRAVDDEGSEGVAETSFFRRAITVKSFAIGDYQEQGETQRKSLNFAYPIIADQGRIQSVIFAALDVSWIGQLAAESNLPPGVALSIVDSTGTLLTRFPDSEKWIGRHIPDASLFEMLQLRGQVIREMVGLDGVDRIYALKPLSKRAGAGQIYAMVGIPKNVAFGEVNRTLVNNLVWLGLVSVLATGLAWLVGSKYVVGYVKVRAEAEESRLKLAAIVESSEDAIIGMTLDGNVTSWNQGAESMYGFTAEEIIGQSVYRLMPASHHDEIRELLEIVKHGRGINRYESRRVRKDGELFDISASLSPIRDLRGTVIGAATITRDVTLLRKGEDQLLAYTDQLETLNSVSQEIAGTLSIAEVMERSLSRLASVNGFDFAFAWLAQDAGGRKFFAAGAAPLPLPGLERIWHELGAEFEQCVWECRNPWFVEDVAGEAELSPAAEKSRIKALAVLPLSQGAPMRAAIVLTSTRVHPFEPDEKQFLQAIAREIALALENARLYGATIEVNQELRKEIEERKRAERTLADFTAMVAHDLRSPLSNVISIAASIRDGLFGSVNEPQQKWLWKIQENCNSLISHVSDFLDISKIDAGRLEVVREPVDVLRLLHDGLSEYSVEAERRQITLKSAITEGLPRLFLDRRRIHRVLENLLSNAIKFTGSGGEIEVGARAWDGSAAVLWVKDTGIGIPSDELELIFDKYHQVTRQQQASQMGTGLGLAICKKIIEAHGGRIWAESEMGKGTTIFLLLPADIATDRLEA